MVQHTIDSSGIILNMLAAAIAIEYIDHGFEKKYRGSKRIILFLAGWLLYFTVVTTFNIYTQFEGMLGIAYGVVLFLYGLTALKAPVHHIIILSLVWILIALISAYMMLSVLGIMAGEGLTSVLETRGDIRHYAALAAAALKFSMGRVVWAMYKGKKSTGYKEDWIMGGIFFLMFVIVLGMFRLEQGGMEQEGRYYLSLYVLAGAFGVILLLENFHRRLDKYRQEKQEAEFKKRVQEKQQEQIRAFYAINREMNHFRHDMCLKLNVIYELLKKEKGAEALNYINQMDQDIKKYPELPQDTGNDGVNVALMKTIYECKEKDIRFRYVVMGKAGQIDFMDMGTLLQNLLSNGIEACLKTKADRELELVLMCRDTKVEIQMENSIESSVMKENPNLISWKEDKELHGFGMQSILEVVEKYHGEYSYTEEDGRFIQNIVLMK